MSVAGVEEKQQPYRRKPGCLNHLKRIGDHLEV